MSGFDVGDTFRIKATALFDEDLENPMYMTFWYKVTSHTGSGDILFVPEVTDALLDDFLTAAITPIIAIQPTNIRWTNLEIVEWTNPLRPFQNLPLVAQTGGATTANAAPKWLVYSFRLNRSNNTTRNGQKRYPGVVEEAMTAGVVPPGAYLDVLHDVETGLAAGLTATDGIDSATLLPCIVRLDPVTGNITASQIAFSATYTRVSSQDSRKG